MLNKNHGSQVFTPDEAVSSPYIEYTDDSISCLYPARIGHWPSYDQKRRRWVYYSLNLREAIISRPNDFEILNAFSLRLNQLAGIHPLALQLVTTLETSFRPMAVPPSSHYTCGPFQLIKSNCPKGDNPKKMMTERRFDDYIKAYFSSAGIDLNECRAIMPTLSIEEQAARLYILTWASSAGKHFTDKEFPTDFIPYKNGMITGLADYDRRFPNSHRSSTINHARHIVQVLLSSLSPRNQFVLVKTPKYE